MSEWIEMPGGVLMTDPKDGDTGEWRFVPGSLGDYRFYRRGVQAGVVTCRTSAEAHRLLIRFISEWKPTHPKITMHASVMWEKKPYPKLELNKFC